jgi:hypothetical protein
MNQDRIDLFARAPGATQVAAPSVGRANRALPPGEKTT